MRGSAGQLCSLTALLRPALEAVVRGYQIASMQETTEAAFRRFVERLAQKDSGAKKRGSAPFPAFATWQGGLLCGPLVPS